MMTIPNDYVIRAADRLDRRGKVCAAVYLLPPENQVRERLNWTYLRPGDDEPRGSELATIAEMIRQRRPVGIFCPRHSDAARMFSRLMDARAAQLGAAA